MENITANLLVPAYFIQVLIGTALLGWWFYKNKDKTQKTFGIGMAGYSLGFVSWTLLVLIKPDNLQPLILTGAIPFLLANLAFAKVAYKNLDLTKSSLLSLIVIGAVAGTFIIRTFVYPSKPYFSDQGLLFFGLHPLSIALYIATMSLTFLPAITVATDRIKKVSTKSVLKVGLTTLFINSIILVSGTDDTLLLINGVVMTIALFTSWSKALSTKAL